MRLTRLLAAALTVVLGAALYACGGGSTGSVVVQAATPLAIVKPAASCAGLASAHGCRPTWAATVSTRGSSSSAIATPPVRDSAS